MSASYAPVVVAMVEACVALSLTRLFLVGTTCHCGWVLVFAAGWLNRVLRCCCLGCCCVPACCCVPCDGRLLCALGLSCCSLRRSDLSSGFAAFSFLIACTIFIELADLRWLLTSSVMLGTIAAKLGIWSSTRVGLSAMLAKPSVADCQLPSSSWKV